MPGAAAPCHTLNELYGNNVMTQVFAFLLPLVIGAGIGWWLRRRLSGVLRFVLAGVAVLFTPVLLILISNVFGSDTLGMIGGLSLLVMVISAPLLALGAIGGWLFSSHNVEHEKTPIVEEQSLNHKTKQPIEPTGVSASTITAPAVLSRLRLQRGLLVTMAGVASAFWVVIAVGFRLSNQRAPAELNAGLLPAFLMLLTALAYGVCQTWRSRGLFTPAPHAFMHIPRPASKAMAEYTSWRVAMANDPRRQRYAVMLDAGDVFWTPDRVEYDLNPRATTCCVHLAPIELTMRECGVRVKLDSIRSVRAECRIDAVLLPKCFVLPACIVYEELHAYDRSMEDPPSAVLSCTACGSRAWVVHPSEAESDTPVFPAGDGYFAQK